MNNREVMHMALPLLVAYQDYTGESRIANKCGEAIQALRQALVQPEPAIGDIRSLKHRIHELEGELIGCKRMLDAQPEQAPVAWLYDFYLGDELVKDWTTLDLKHLSETAFNIRPLYAAPPKREWVWLTDEEIPTFDYAAIQFLAEKRFARDIEAKLKEKNT